MRRYRVILFAVAILLLSAIASVAVPNPFFRVLNFPNVNPFDLVQYAPFQMKQGWENNQLVWFICTDTNDLQTACSTTFPLRMQAPASPNSIIAWPVGFAFFANGINFSPKLTSAAGHVATVYVITNVNQGPVFTAVPGDPTYSGIWQVVYVTFKPGVTPFCVNNAAPYNPVTNPHGLPGPDLATFRTTNAAGIPVIVKYPIMAVGPLGGPWTPAVPGSYRIPQGKVTSNYAYTKIIWLPFWNVYCSSFVTKAVMVRQIIVPDVWDPTGALTTKLGANNAPGLAAFPTSDEQPFYWQMGPQPINQFPILHACTEPGEFPCRNLNADYTPVEFVVQLQRNVPPLRQSTVINNENTLLQFIGAGCLTEISRNVIIDAPVLPILPDDAEDGDD